MERHFDQELEELKEKLLKMGKSVEVVIGEAITALKTLDADKAREVLGYDDQIDALETAIEKTCVDMMALHQPVAIDLRFIAMAMKIATDLERMGDLAAHIAKRVLSLADKPMLKKLEHIPHMTDLVQKMTSDVLASFIARDVKLAAQVILMDEEVDQLRNTNQDELVDEYMTKDPATVPQAMPLLLISRHLERIADHATNIAEDVIYMVNARMVKHHAEPLPL
jgi:phosphate transport system protein